MSFAGGYGAGSYGGQAYGGGAAPLKLGLVLCISGAEFSPFLMDNTIRISDTLNNRNSAAFRIVDTTNTFRFRVGEPVIIMDELVRIFAGTIEQSNEVILNPSVTGASKTTVALDVRCVDFNQLADRHLVARDFENILAGDIVKEVVDFELSGEGVTDTFVQDSLLISRAVFNHNKASTVFDELSERTGTYWFIDYFKRMHFEERSTTIAPFAITDGDSPVRNIRVKKSRDRYRNRQFIRAGRDVSDAQTESHSGDSESEQQVFVVSLPIAETPTITVNSIAQSVGVLKVDDETAFQWYFQKDEKEITQRKTDTPLSDTDVIAITFKGFFPIIVQAQDEVEQATRQTLEGGTGIYEDLIVDERLDKRGSAIERASGLLRRFGKIPTTVSFQTDKTGLASGQLVSITLADEQLSGTFLIDNVSYTNVSFQTGRYTVRALSGEHLGGWQAFFKKLLDAGQRIVIRENEVILLLRELPNTIELLGASNSTDALGSKSTDFWTDMEVSSLTEDEDLVQWDTGTANTGKLDD